MWHAIVCIFVLPSLTMRALATQFQTVSSPMGTLNALNSESFFDIVVADSTGEDASGRISIFHHERKLSSLADRRRAASREINDCPAEHIVETSRCVRRISPQAYSTICRNVIAYENDLNNPAAGVQAHGPGAPFQIFAGSCAANEFCVESTLGFLTNRVFCISSHSFYLLAHNQVAGESTVGSSWVGIPPNNNNAYGVEAILTGVNPQQSVFASNLNLQAQASTTIHDIPAWRTVENGTSYCADCSSIGLEITPKSIQRFQLNVELPAGVTVGEMWLTSWIP